MKSTIIATTLFVSLALAVPVVADQDANATGLEKRACKKTTCCWGGICGYKECLNGLCDAFPESLTCPIGYVLSLESLDISAGAANGKRYDHQKYS
ncbi:hypothetical protein F5144DRAFT_597816 [Chaetomium tenue]|uniref:Uncharacterized protein n=1 Tax=Chaetomium tenue TaxID=1854479 RepID=A0ACB7PN94_9PEZI|nr:hypothetical protein F5144DRAFT_597816 [Chaetomium globosum]